MLNQSMIIFSPTKEMLVSKENIIAKQILFPKSANIINEHLQKMTINDIKQYFKLKENVALKTNSYFQDQNFYNAKKTYSGLSFRQVVATNIEYENNHIFILSAKYGLVPFNSSISPYRLDFSKSLNGLNLFNM